MGVYDKGIKLGDIDWKLFKIFRFSLFSTKEIIILNISNILGLLSSE